METDCRKYSGDNCRHYPECWCMVVDRSVKYPFKDAPLCNDCTSIDECGSIGCIREKDTVTDRCNDCKTVDTCNIAGCIGPEFEPCSECSDLFNCPTLGCLTREVVCELDEGCEVDGRIEDCVRCNPVNYEGQTDDYLPGLDGRNESPVNRHGCSYVDCGCEIPCTSDPQKIVNITINGTMNGDIVL